MLVSSSVFKDFIDPYNEEYRYRDYTYWGSRVGGYTVRMSPTIYVPSKKTLKSYPYLSYYKDDLSKFTTKFEIPKGDYFMLHSGQRVIIETMETFKLPFKGIALVTHSVPELSLLGLEVSSTVVFPDDLTDDWVNKVRKGKLRLSLRNTTERNFQLIGEMPIAVVLFQQFEVADLPKGIYDYDYTR